MARPFARAHLVCVGMNKTAALVLGVLCCAASPASAQGCPADTNIPDWVSITTSNQGPGSTSDPEPDPCSMPLHFEVELRGGRRIRVPAEYGLARLLRDVEAC